jgi:6-phosphogluconolactonase
VHSASQRFHLGTYTNAGGRGLGSGRLDQSTGRPTIETWTDVLADPSWLELSPDRQTLYAVSELSPNGMVAAFAVRDGPAQLNRQPVLINQRLTGAKPAHVKVHPSGAFLFTSLYDGGAVAVHPVHDDGSIGSVCDLRVHQHNGRQARAHQVELDPTGTHVLAVDLGLDVVFTYRLDQTGRLDETSRTTFAAGSGPRHLVFHPRGDFAYVVHELDSTVTVCRWQNGVLEPLDTLSTSPQSPNYPGEIVISPDGRFLYVSNRGSNTVGVFAVEDGGAHLNLRSTPSCGGDWPRHLAIDAGGSRLYVANERSGDLSWFELDPTTGVPGAQLGSVPVPGITQILLSQPGRAEPTAS